MVLGARAHLRNTHTWFGLLYACVCFWAESSKPYQTHWNTFTCKYPFYIFLLFASLEIAAGLYLGLIWISFCSSTALCVSHTVWMEWKLFLCFSYLCNDVYKTECVNYCLACAGKLCAIHTKYVARKLLVWIKRSIKYEVRSSCRYLLTPVAIYITSGTATPPTLTQTSYIQTH